MNPLCPAARPFAILAALAGLTGYGWWATHGGLMRQGHWIAVDFHVYYQTALVLRAGGDIYHAGIAPLYVYPPLLAGLTIPLTWLPVDAATMLWKLLQHVCLIGAGTLLVSLLPRPARLLGAALLLLGALTIPIHDEIEVGESNSLVLLLEVGAIWLIARRGAGQAWSWATMLAGGLLALAASIKVLPVLLIAYFWWRGPRRLADLATGAFLAIQAITLVLIPGTATYWLDVFPGLFGQAFPFLDNQSLNAAIARALGPSDPGQPVLQLVGAPVLWPYVTWAANLLVLGILFVSSIRGREQRTRVLGATGPQSVAGLLLETGLVLLTIHLVSGSTWMHHLVDLAVPLCGLLATWWPPAASTDAPRAALRAPGWPLGGWRTAGLALAFVLLIVSPADWVALASRIAPGQVPLAWLASNSGLAVVLGAWLATLRCYVGWSDNRSEPRISRHPV